MCVWVVRSEFYLHLDARVNNRVASFISDSEHILSVPYAASKRKGVANEWANVEGDEKNIVCSERMTFKRKIFARKIDTTFFFFVQKNRWNYGLPCLVALLSLHTLAERRAQTCIPYFHYNSRRHVVQGTAYNDTPHAIYMAANTQSTMCRLRDYTLWWWSFHTTLYPHIYIIKNPFFPVSRREPGESKKICVCFTRMKYGAFAQRCLLGAAVTNSSPHIERHVRIYVFVLYARIGGRTLHHTYPVNLCRIVF